MLEIRNICKTFNAGTINEKVALSNVSITLNDGDFCTVIGGFSFKTLRIFEGGDDICQ